MAMLAAPDPVDPRADLDRVAEQDGRQVVDLDHGQDERHAADRVDAQHVDEVAHARLLDVAGDDRVVDVPKCVDVAEPHLDARAVAEFVAHGGTILHAAPHAADSVALPLRAPRRPARSGSPAGWCAARRSTGPAIRRPSGRRRRSGRARPGSAVPAAEVVLRVARAAGGSVAQLEAKLAGDGDGQLRQAAGGRRPLHRRVAAMLPQLAGHAVDGRRRRSAAPPRRAPARTRRAVAARRSSCSAAARRHDVGTGAALDDAGVHRHAGPSAIERMQRHHLARGGQDRAAALLRLHAGVRGAAVIRDLQIRDALARADDVAVGAGALQHQGHVVLRRQVADVLAC